jgi:hypothetical protein
MKKIMRPDPDFLEALAAAIAAIVAVISLLFISINV